MPVGRKIKPRKKLKPKRKPVVEVASKIETAQMHFDLPLKRVVVQQANQAQLALNTALEEAFGIGLGTLIAWKQADAFAEVRVMCTLAQFAVFCALRVKYGAENWMQELRPTIWHDPNPKYRDPGIVPLVDVSSGEVVMKRYVGHGQPMKKPLSVVESVSEIPNGAKSVVGVASETRHTSDIVNVDGKKIAEIHKLADPQRNAKVADDTIEAVAVMLEREVGHGSWPQMGPALTDFAHIEIARKVRRHKGGHLPGVPFIPKSEIPEGRNNTRAQAFRDAASGLESKAKSFLHTAPQMAHAFGRAAEFIRENMIAYSEERIAERERNALKSEARKSAFGEAYDLLCKHREAAPGPVTRKGFEVSLWIVDALKNDRVPSYNNPEPEAVDRLTVARQTIDQVVAKFRKLADKQEAKGRDYVARNFLILASDCFRTARAMRQAAGSVSVMAHNGEL